MDKVKIITDESKVEIPVSPCCIIINCEDAEDAAVYANAYKYKAALDSMWDVLWRPRHKHGYSNQELNELIAKDITEDEESTNDVNRAMDILEEMYRELLREIEED